VVVLAPVTAYGVTALAHVAAFDMVMAPVAAACPYHYSDSVDLADLAKQGSGVVAKAVSDVAALLYSP